MDINIKELQEKFIALIRRGETLKSEFKLGIEIEHIIVKEDTLESVNYYEANGIQDILKALLPQGYEAIY
jgi:glutamate--cysteine ligase